MGVADGRGSAYEDSHIILVLGQNTINIFLCTVVYRITEPWLGAKKMALLSVLALLGIQKFLVVVVGEPRKRLC